MSDPLVVKTSNAWQCLTVANWGRLRATDFPPEHMWRDETFPHMCYWRSPWSHISTEGFGHYGMPLVAQAIAQSEREWYVSEFIDQVYQLGPDALEAEMALEALSGEAPR